MQEVVSFDKLLFINIMGKNKELYKYKNNDNKP